MKKAFVSKYLFDGTALLENKAVLVDQGNIINIVNKESIPDDVEVVNFGSGVITPGFIDLQVNGCGGVLFNECISYDTLQTIYETWLKFGTVCFLPTLITTDFKNIILALEVVKDWFDKYSDTRGVVGIHLEGPFISKLKPGIHPKELIIEPRLELLQQIVNYRKYFPIKMTIAVEQFTPEQIKFLIDNDIVLSIGHSNASYDEAMGAINLGIKTSTHMFNAMTGLTGRNPGVIGAILSSNIYTGVIVDMAHVDCANVQLLKKIKQQQVYLVTDAITVTGTDIKEFQFENKTIYVRDDKCMDKDGVLAGANLTMNEAVKNCVEKCKIDLVDSLKMASLIPAEVMGIDNIFGKIKPNYRAQLVYLDLNDFSCKICS